MASYRLEIKPSAVKELEAVRSRADRRRIVERVGRLYTDPRPRGCVRLSGLEQFRVRQGRYRIVYSVDDTEMVVTVVKIGHRRDVYR